MAKLMWIAGILLVAVGVALGLMVFFSTASMIGWGITPEVAVLMLVGGILALGQGGIINAVETVRSIPLVAATAPAAAPPPAAIPEFGRRLFETPAPAAGAAEPVSPAVKETIQALEQAKQDLRNAFEEKPAEELPVAAASAAEGAPVEVPAEKVEAMTVEAVTVEAVAVEEDVVEEPPAAEEQEPAEEGQLYVVEERVIRDRPARILSDGTVEAETDEGWMRFENLEHLDEYLEAMSPAPRT